jgi:Uma2 family endonuclease
MGPYVRLDEATMLPKVEPSIPPGPRKLSVDELELLPNDGKRYQILDGELDVTPSPVPRHQRISRRLERLLEDALAEGGRGEVFDAPIDVVLDRHNVVVPDLVFVSRERAGIVGEKFIEGSPDLLVEILSPSTRRTDIRVKSELYARFGVSWYLIVDPDIDRIEVYRLAGRSYELLRTGQSPGVLELPELGGIRIALDKLFGP